MNDVKLDRNTLIMLGNTVSEILLKSNITTESQLNIYVDEYAFKKIDEDLYYRGEEKTNDFEPSENNIELKFKNLVISIKKE